MKENKSRVSHSINRINGVMEKYAWVFVAKPEPPVVPREIEKYYAKL